MTFGSTFGRTFSPTFQPSSQAAVAGGGWWDLNGAITSCVAAYQPKGAASYAASLADLSGNDNDATEGTAPAWDATNGWKFDGTNDYLKTGVVNADGVFTVVVRYSNGQEASEIAPLFGAYTGAGRDSEILPRFNTTKIYYINGASYVIISPSSGLTGGVLAIAGTTAYRNGSPETGSIGAWSGTGTAEYYIACLNNNGSPERYLACNIQGIAFYNSVLTAQNISDLSTAMAAL